MNLAKNLRLVACLLLAALSGCIEDKSRQKLSDGPDPSATLGTVSANPSSGVVANGVAVSAITVTVVDDTGAPLANHVVQLTSTGANNTIVQPAVTNASGVATGTISSTVAETKTITATIDPGANAIVLAQQPTIEFVADAGSISAVVSTASAAPATGVLADGTAVSTITVTVRDQNGNGIAAQVVQLAATGSNNTLVQPTVTNALGVATGTIASTTAETKTITATINPGASQTTVAQQPTVVFVGDPNTVSATISVVTASPATGVLANGSAISTVSVTLRDVNGNPVAGQAVQVSSTGSNNTFVQPGVTDAGGVTSGTIASTTAETKTITATVNPGAGQVVLAQQPTVQFVADPSNISALLSTATAAPTLGVLADGVTISTITVTVRDGNGNPLAGQAVSLAASGSNNTLVQPGLTDASGVATGTIASTMAEIKTITATINPGAGQVVIAQQPTVQFVGSALSISGTLSTASASPATGVLANGVAVSTITVTVRDSNGNPVEGQAVQLASSGSNNILVQPVVTDASGVATGTIASTMAETKTITATINPGVGQIVIAQQPTVDFVADPNNISAVLTTATASPASGVLANGSAISTITVTVRDQNGNAVAGQAVQLSSSGSNNILVQPALTDAFGVASGTIASLTAEQKTITAIVNPGAGQVVVAQQPTVDFVADPNNISAVLTTATASPATGVIANGVAISTITVTVRDINGNPVAGQVVDLAATGSNNVLVQPGLTDAFGVANGTIASITAELKTITATVNPGASQIVVAQQPTVDFVGDPSTINALLSSATAAPTLGVLADGVTTSTITVTVRDSNGNAVPGQAVDLAATGSNNILVQPGLTDAFGVASGTIASTTAEIKTITATINPGAAQVVVPQQPTVEFVSNPATISALLSTATAAPALGVIADGAQISTITVTVRDINGNPVAGQAVQLDASGSNNILVQPGVTDALGVASGTIASITAETKTITATINPGASQVVITQQPTVEFVGDPSTINALQTSATAAPATGVIADGAQVSTITVTVRDSNGNPVAGQAVALAASGSNNILVQPGLTDAFGVASGTIASITAELKTITATVNPGASQVVVAQQPTVQFVGDPNNISGVLTTASASPATGVLANGSAISTITVTVLDINGNPVVGQAVDLAATGSNNILVQPGLTDAFGVASGTIASTSAETKTITATVNPGASQIVVAQQPTVEFVADANNISAVLTTASASPATGVIADGAQISTITVTVRDQNGNPVPGQAVELASSGSNNILVQPGLTDALGVASGTIASITAELKTITATVNPGAGQIVVAQQPTVDFVGDPSTISALLTTASAAPATGVIADGSAVSTITVTVRDSNGNPVAGQAVDLAATGSNNILVQPGLTDAFGVASGSIASTSAETKTITATVNPGASQIVVAQQPTVEFVADPNNISAVLSTASASPATGVLADGSAISTITVTLRDQNGNPVPGQAVELSSTGGNNILVQPGLTDAFGVASGTIASTTAETKIITATVNPGASQVVVAQQPTVDFVADPNNISAVLTTASASPATGVLADGLAVSTITVTVRDQNGNAVAGQVVDLAASGSNNVLVQPGLTDAFGVASGTIASISAELKTITATVNPGASQIVVAQQPTVQFVGDPNNISGVLTSASAAPATGVLANGSAISTITVTVRDQNGNPVAGQAVQLASSGSNNILVQPGLTDAFGVASGSIASITAELKTITATVNPGASQVVVAQQPTVDFVADPNNISAVLTTASASPATGVIADGSAISTITVTVRDSNGNPVAGQVVDLAASGSNNVLVQPGLTDAFGVASGSIASITAEIKVITATVNPGASQIVVAQQPTVQFVGDPNNISALLTTATAAPTLGVPTDGLSTSAITVTVRDGNGNPVAGQVVDLAATGSNNILVQPGLTNASGVASGSIASTMAEIKTITATVNPGASQVVVAQQPTVEFVANPATISDVLTTAVAAPASGVIANGSEISTITVTVRDVNGNPVPGQAVQLASSGINNILVQPGVTDASGVASGTIASTTAEQKTITATVNPGFSQVVVAQQPTVDFVADPSTVSAVLTTATASPATGVIADGSAISTITVTVRDGNGNPLPGLAVQLSSTGSNNILVQPGLSDAFGVATGTIASTTAETKTITATINPGALQVVVVQQPTVEFVADPSTISALLSTAAASPATGVIANGSAISTITVTLRDANGNPVAGQAVALASSGSNNLLVQPGVTDAFGVASGSIASTSAEQKTITATVNPGASQIVVAQQPTVEFVGDPSTISGVLTSASASPATGVLADGAAISTITVTVRDQNGNPVAGQVVELAASGSNNTLVQPGLTDASGVASGTIASTTAETKTITATVNPGASQVVVAQQPTVEFVADPNNISAVLTTASASPATGVLADGLAISTITVTVRDSNGNPVAGQAVSLAASGSNNTLVQPGLTDASGVASGTIASLTAETKTIIATVNPGASQVVVAQQPTVEFVGDPSTISALLTTATAAPAAGVIANGSAVSTITVTVRDQNGNPVAGQAVDLAATGSNNILVQPGLSDNFGVASGTIASTTAEIKTITATVNPGASQVVVVQQPTVQFVADPSSISASLSSSSASPASGVIANGTSVSTITIVVLDVNGNPVAGQVVQLSSSGSNNILVQPGVTDPNGVATGTIASTTAETKVITVTVNPGAGEVVLAQQPSVTFVADPNNISGVLTTASASPATGVIANGSAISTITVTVRDINGNPVAGQVVDLASTGSNNTLVQPGLTDAFGVASGTIASLTAELKTITATVNPGASQVVVAQQPTVDFVGDPSTISNVLTTASAAPATGVVANGVAISTITVTVRDQNGNGVAGQVVELAASGSNNTLVQPGLTDAFGVATGTIASIRAETKTITATVNPGAGQTVVAQQPTVDFVADASNISAVLSTSSASPANGVIANGSSVSTITIVVLDSNGNPVAGQVVQLSSSGSNNILVQPLVTDPNGVATGTIASTTAETKVITATVNPGAGEVVLAQQPAVTFVGDPNNISGLLTTASAAPAVGVIADGVLVSTITVTVRDINGNPVAGQAVDLAATGLNNTLVQPGLTDASGVASGTIASITAEIKTISATVNPGASQIPVAQQPTVEFVGDPNNISAVLSSTSASPANGIIANGVEVSTITITVRDINGNPVVGQLVELSASGSNNILVQPGITDPFGVATGTIASTTAETKVITATAGLVVIAQQQSVTFVPDPNNISATLTTAVASPAMGVIADGSAISTITVTVRDIYGNPVAGQVVDLAATGSNNTLVQPGLTDALGVASGTIASLTAELKTITATVNPGASQVVVAQQPTVDFVGDPSTINNVLTTASAAPATGVIANGSAISTITVTVRDVNGNPVAGQAVQLDASGTNNALVQPGLTDAFGVATGTIASIKAETKTITATVNPGASQVVVAQQPTVEFIGDANNISAVLSTSSASPANGVIANGSSVSTITIVVRDSNGNPVAGQVVQLGSSGSNNILVQPLVTDPNGVATGTIATTTAETKTITVTVNPGAGEVVLAQQPAVTFVGDPSNISAALTTASASPESGVIANGVAVSTITVTVRDINGNPVAGQAVDLAATGLNNTLVQPGVTDASGVASGTIASITAEVKTITATVNPGASQIVVAQQPTVGFIGDASTISAVLTSASASPAAGVIANGVALSTITVTVRDQNGNGVAGQAVSLAATGSNNTLVQPGLTNALGVASGTIASIAAETKVITATVNPGASQVVIAQQPSVEFIPDASNISALLSTAVASPATGVIANGSAISTITVTVRDQNGNPVPGQAVSLAATGSNNTLVQPSLTNASGVASGTINSITAETKVITATVNPGASQIVVAQQPTVEFVGDPSTITASLATASASPASGVIANGSAVSTITVTVRDVNGNGVAGQAVSLAATGSSNTLVQPGLTNASGVATGTIASIVAETKTITATVNPGAGQIVVPQQPTVGFVGDASNISALLSTASASPTSGLIANGTDISTVTVTVRDVNGNPIAGQLVQLSSSGSNNTFVQPGATDASGVASGTIASIRAETKTLTATINPGAGQVVVAQHPTVTFDADANNISATLTTASASPASGVIANNSAISTITVTVRDINGNPVPAQAVSLAATGSNNTLVQPSGLTNASGVATGTIASLMAETKTITATVNPGASQIVVAQQPTVVFVGDPSTITTTTATASPATGVIADGSAVSTITVTVRDINNNPVVNQVVRLAATGSNNTLVQPANTNSSGVATGTIRSIRAETKTITATINPGAGQIVVPQQPTVEFVADPNNISAGLSTVTASPNNNVLANGTTTSTVTVTVRDVNGNLVSSRPVQLSSTGTNNIFVQPGVTNSSGVTTGTIASTTAQLKTLTATVNPGAGQVVLSQHPTVDFVSVLISATLSTATANPAFGVAADGVAISTITITVRSTSNTLVSGMNVTFTATGAGNTLVQPASPTNASGVTTGTIRSTVAETKTITVTMNPGPSQIVLTMQPTVTFVDTNSQIYYVRTTGNDANNGRSPAAAWKSLQKAANTLVPGDRVYVGKGAYSGGAIENTSGTAANPITYIADSKGAWTGDGAGAVIVSGGVQGFTIGGSYITFDGFTLTNNTEAILVAGGCVGAVVRNCTFYGDGIGIQTGAGASAIIESNVLSNLTDQGGGAIYLDSPNNSLVRNNLIYNNAGDGIYAAAGTCTITGNTLYQNAAVQVRAPANGTFTATNNVIVNGGATGIEVSSGGIFTSSYNLIWANATGNWVGLAMGPGDISTNPFLDDPDGWDNLLGGSNGADDRFHLNLAMVSPGFDAGSAPASTFSLTDGSTLADRSSRTDSVLDGSAPDAATVNMGYHYQTTLPSQPDLLINDGRVYYGVGNNPQPGVRTWNDLASSWSAEGLAAPAGSTIRWTVHQVSPLITQQQLLGVLSDSGSATRLNLLRWNGLAWSLEWSAGAIAPSQAGKRGFDVAYEQASGDALVVYSNNTNTPRYRTRTAGLWSAELALPVAPLSGIVQWVQLAARPGSNEIALAYSDANADLAVLVWDGSVWSAATSSVRETNLKTNAVTGAVSNRAFDLAYETSGELMVAWGRLGSNGFWYSTKAAGSSTWTASNQVSQALSSVPHFVDLASEPGSDRLAIVVCGLGDGVERMGFAIWNGNNWINRAEADAQITNANDTAIGDFPAAVAWVGTSGTAICVYADDQAGTLDWAQWTGGGWNVQSDVALPGKGITESVELKTFASGNRVMLLLSDSNSDLFALWTDGTSWNTTNGGLALSTSLSSISSVPFSFAIKPQ